MSRTTLLAVGKIVKAFGIQGEVVVLPMTADVHRFRKLQRVLVGKTDAATIETEVTQVMIDQRGVRLRLANVPDRTAAEKSVGNLLFVDEANAVKLPRGEYFIHDLIGLTVVTAEGERIGMLKDVLKYPANDIYVIDAGGREVLIPAVKKFIKRIDMQRKSITVELIDGMLDESTGASERE